MPYSNDDFWDINGVLWVQPYGPNTKPEYLGCHDLDGPTIPKGTTSKGLCVSPTSSRRFNVKSAAKGPPGAPTATLTTTVAKTADWLNKVDCPMPIYVHQQICDPRNSFMNFARGSVLHYADVQSTTRSNMARGRWEEGDTPTRAEQSFDLQLDAVEDYFIVTPDRVLPAVTHDAAARDIVYCDVEQCQGPCGEYQDECEIGYIVMESDAPATNDAVVLETLDGGATWAATATEPFGTGDVIASIVCVPKGDSYRLIVANGTAGGGNAEIAWSDDGGDTWNNVIMPTGAAGDYAHWGGALCMLGYYHVWFACGQPTSGRIYFSADGGVSWIEQEDAAGQPFFYIRFCDEYYGLAVGGSAAGAAGIIYHTTDGGAHWSAVAEPAAQADIQARCCEILDNHRWWVGYYDGELWYTNAGSLTMVAADWAERGVDTPSGHVAVNRINDIMATDDFNIWFVAVDDKETADDALGASLHRSFDGGYDWQVWDFGPFDESGDSLAAIWVCDYDESQSVGAPLGAQVAIYVTVPTTT